MVSFHSMMIGKNHQPIHSWAMGLEKRGTGNGELEMENGERRTENRERRTENREQRTENGERRTGNEERRTGNGEWGIFKM